MKGVMDEGRGRVKGERLETFTVFRSVRYSRVPLKGVHTSGQAVLGAKGDRRVKGG